MLQRTLSALSLTTALSLTFVASTALAQDRAQSPKAQSPKAQSPKAQSPKAQSPKAQSPKAQSAKARPPAASKRSPKQDDDQRDDALFGGGEGEAVPSDAPEEPAARAGSPDPLAQDPSLVDSVEDEPFGDLETESSPATREAEQRGSTRQAPRLSTQPQPEPLRWVVTPVGSAPARPSVLAWSDGTEIPDGYEKGTRVRKGLVIGGAVTFGVSWLAAGAFGVHLANQRDPHAWQRDDETPDEAVLFIPVAGPWVALGSVELERGQAAALIADGVAQAGGLALLAAGIFAQETVLVKTETATVGVAPLVGPSGNGLTLLGSF